MIPTPSEIIASLSFKQKLLKSFRPTAIMLALMGLLGVFLYLTHQPVFWWSYAALSVFYGMVFFLGAYAEHFKNETNHEEVLVAGRKVPLLVGVFTMAATWIDGSYINGTAEATASTGLVGVQAPWGYALSLIVGGLLFARPMRRGGYNTMLDPIEHKFGKTVASLSFLPALSGEIFWTAAVLTALGTTFSTVIGLDFTWAIIISAAITIVYTMLGGLWAVAMTDVFQLIFLLVGLYVILPFALTHTGGLAHTWTLYSSKHGESANLLPPLDGSYGNKLWNWIDISLLLIFGGIPWQVYFQRVLSARSENAAMWLSIAAGFLCIAAAIPASLLGMVGDVVDWRGLGLTAPESATQTLPYVIRYLTPAPIAVLGLAVIAAAVMSSVDASMLSASSLFSWNIYHRVLKPNATPVEVSKVIQRSVLIIGVAATLLAITYESVYALWVLCSDFVYCILFPQLVCALFDKRANKIGALSGMAVAVFLRAGGGEPALHLPTFLPYPMIEDGIVLFPFRTLAMLSSLLTIIMVSRIATYVTLRK